MKKKLIKKIAQIYANFLISGMRSSSNEQFEMLYEQAAWINSYCVVIHDIYLD
jgi:hypothetical protein